MGRRWLLSLALLACAASLAGCGQVERYTMRRVADAMDMFTFELTPAFGMEMHAQFLCFGAAVGYADSPLVGPMMHGRRIGFGKRKTYGWLIRGVTLCTQPLSKYSIVVSHRSRTYEPNEDWWGFGAFKHQGQLMSYEWLDWPELFDIGMGGTLGVVEMHMGINPAEAVDFILGFVEIDFARDDVGRLENRGFPHPTKLSLPFLKSWSPPR